MREFRKKLKDEKGFATAVLAIALLPIVFAMVGFAFDFARAGYIRSQLLGSADTALQSTTNMGYIDNGQVRMGRPGDPGYSQREAARLYCANGPHFGDCAGDTIVAVVGTPLTLAELCQPLGVRRYGLSLRATETIPTIFLGIIGQSTITLEIDTSASVRPRSC
jgi:hypothetical protein